MVELSLLFLLNFTVIKQVRQKDTYVGVVFWEFPHYFVLLTVIYLARNNLSQGQNEYQLSQDVSIKNGCLGRHPNTSF